MSSGPQEEQERLREERLAEEQQRKAKEVAVTGKGLNVTMDVQVRPGTQRRGPPGSGSSLPSSWRHRLCIRSVRERKDTSGPIVFTILGMYVFLLWK